MTALALRFSGSIGELSLADQKALLDREAEDDDLVRDTVAATIDLVRREGDQALRALAREYDGSLSDRLEIPMSECDDALNRLPGEVRRALERAARNIETVHRAGVPVEIKSSPEPGISISRRPLPLERVGVYAPGGKAAYPSSVLMGAVPARVAGVREVVVATPPGASGVPSRAVLAACAVAGVNRVFAAGGAGAIAAMAYGTSTIPRVDCIVGPGNRWVTEAKLQVAKVVSTDSPAGPSELLVIADDSADPAGIAREVIAQAEHDEDACVVVLAMDSATADRIEGSVLAQAAATSRKATVSKALANQGGVLTAGSRDQAITLANAYAPEHLLLAVRDAETWQSAILNAGAVFVGSTTSVTLGDYITGANHVLPTAGRARSYSGLSIDTFFRWTSFQHVSRDALRSLAQDTAILAELEGLDAHARAAQTLAGGEPQ